MIFHRPHPKRQSLLSSEDQIPHGPASNRELELEQVNQALRDELSNEVSINRSNEKYISIWNVNIPDEISDIKEQLEKALRDSESRENYVDYLEQRPITITPTINGIVDYLNIISDAGNRFERLVLEIYPRANARAVNAENQVMNLQTQLTNLQAQLANSQTQLATIQNDYDLLYQAYEAHRTQHNIFKSRELDGRITIQCKTDGAITTHLLNLITNRYTKWKNKCKTLENDLLLADVQLDNKWGKWKTRTRNSEQLINNLQAQILLLHNNPPNMATVAGDLTSIAPLIAEIPNYSKQIPPDEWYQRINQILTLLSITAVAFNDALRADILKSKMAGKYTNIPAQYAGNNIDTPAHFIAWLRHKYQTETVGTQQVATQRLAQEKFLPFDNPESYEARIRPLLLGVADNDANILGLLKGHLSGELYTWMKIANPAGINAFFTELKNMWLERPPNLYRGSIPSIPDQISQTLAVNIQNKSHSDSSSISQAELDSMIKSQLALVPTSSIQVPDKYMPEKPPDGYGVNSEKFIHCDLINPTPSASRIIESLANDLYKKVSDMFSAKPVQSKKNIEVDSDEELADRMGKLSINKALSKGFEAGVHAIIKSSKHRCSNCNRTGHNSRKCPRKKSKNSKRSSKNKKGKINMAINNSGSDSDSNSSDNNSDSGSDSDDTSSETESMNVSKSHKIDKEPKSRKKGGSKQTVLEQTIRKIIQSELKDILPSLLQELNFNNEKSYHIQDNNYREPAPEISNSDEDETLDDPMEIDFVCQKEPDTGIATIPCKIKRLKIPAMILDSGAETEIVTEDIVKRINGKIDRSVKCDLSGIATVPIESIGIVRNLPITLTPDCTIYEDFVVVKHSKPMLIFSNRLFKKYECVIDWNNNKMKIHHNGKDHIFPVTMHKVKNKLEVNYATATQDDSHNEDTITSKPLVSDQISQEVDSDKDDSIPLEEWHAPAGFSSDSVDSSFKKNA
ncbi:hypothetical protein C2G38_2206696 [Gigaspora rosea]|uniref:CCHC-type domain-containing protein n=1 Tax=Gigaspora rosea TaxID=44941 RepID=A0A397UIX5_9GLOM|nr:hypothetical protein C2G38_2206696 [Gigaspora rosea]